MAQSSLGAPAHLDWLDNLCAHADSAVKGSAHHPNNMVGIVELSCASLLEVVSDDLVLNASLTSLHPSLNPGTKILRVANTFVATKSDLAAVHGKSRRAWLGVADPSSPTRLVDTEAVAAFQAWREILSSTSTIMSMRSPPVLPVTAAADAMASSDMAGLGALATLADGRTVWFQFRISLAEVHEHWSWVGSDMQKNIAVWELLAQFAFIGPCHTHVAPSLVIRVQITVLQMPQLVSL